MYSYYRPHPYKMQPKNQENCFNSRRQSLRPFDNEIEQDNVSNATITSQLNQQPILQSNLNPQLNSQLSVNVYPIVQSPSQSFTPPPPDMFRPVYSYTPITPPSSMGSDLLTLSGNSRSNWVRTNVAQTCQSPDGPFKTANVSFAFNTPSPNSSSSGSTVFSTQPASFLSPNELNRALQAAQNEPIIQTSTECGLLGQCEICKQASQISTQHSTQHSAQHSAQHMPQQHHNIPQAQSSQQVQPSQQQSPIGPTSSLMLQSLDNMPMEPPMSKKERRRTLCINNAFAQLRGCIPNVPPDTKLSKIKTLRLATAYIAHLMECLEKNDGDSTSLKKCEDFKVDLQRFKGKTKAQIFDEMEEETKKIIQLSYRAKRPLTKPSTSSIQTSTTKHIQIPSTSKPIFNEISESDEASSDEIENRRNKGRTGWPQHVWKQNLQDPQN